MAPRIKIECREDGLADVQIVHRGRTMKKTVTVSTLADAFQSVLETKRIRYAIVSPTARWRVEIYSDGSIELADTEQRKPLTFAQLFDFLEEQARPISSVPPARLLAVLNGEGEYANLKVSVYSQRGAVAELANPLAPDGVTRDAVSLSRLAAWLESLDPHGASRKMAAAVLPPGTIGYASWGDGTEVVIMYREPGPADLLFYDTLFRDVPLPGLVFRFEVKPDRKPDVRVAALKTKDCSRIHAGPVDANPQLWKYPFGNCYSNGTVCWGRNSLPETKSLRELPFLMRLFLAAPHNGDLVPNSVNLREWFARLAGQAEFPEEELISLGQRLQDWL